MSNLLAQYKFDDEVHDQKTKHWKYEVERIMVIGHKFSFEQTLYKVREVFDHHRKEPGNKSNDRA